MLMGRNAWMWALPLGLTLSACFCDKGDTGDDSGDTRDEDDDEGEGAEDDDDSWPVDDEQPDHTGFSATWGEASVDLVFSPSAHDDLLVGIAETADSDDPWTGEDCLSGYARERGDVLGPYCHVVLAGDTVLSLTYGGDPNDLLSGTTVFDASSDGRVTYIVSDSAGACWTWGDDPSYYADQGCTEL